MHAHDCFFLSVYLSLCALSLSQSHAAAVKSGLHGVKAVHWSAVAGDRRALVDPRSASGTNAIARASNATAANASEHDHRDDLEAGARKLGAWSTSNPQACRQSVVVDITLAAAPALAPAQWRRLSLYLVDYERAGAQFAVEMRELPSLALAAPTQRFVDTNATGGGMYLTYEAATSVRFRVMEITGDYPRSDADVSVSAVFVD
jgi:hypothetical protein